MNLFRDEDEILEGVRLRGLYKTKLEANEEIVRLVRVDRRIEADNIKNNYPWASAPSGYEFVELKHDELLFHPSKWKPQP